MSPESRKARGKLARATRDHGPDSPEVIAARQDFTAERAADPVRAIDDPVILARAAKIVRTALARLSDGARDDA